MWVHMAKVAIYVQKQYAKPTYSVESFNARQWHGLSMLRDVLERAGIEVDYCSASTVTRHRVVLDYWSYAKERETWPKGDYRTLVGGAGMLNVHPFLWTNDVWWFGRAEHHIVGVVQAMLKGDKYDHPRISMQTRSTGSRRPIAGIRTR
jgi:hypothetical protein